VNVIRHHDSGLKIELDFIVVQAALKNDRTHTLWKSPPMMSAECNKVLPIIALKMRKFSAIESLRHSSCRDSRPRLSSGAKLRSLEV
jgi:hypothetical protein